MATHGSGRELRATTDEIAPLLGNQLESSSPSTFAQNVPAARLVVYVFYFLALELGQTLPKNALHQVVEETLCQEMHGRSDAKFCGGNNDVQSALAVLFGWYNTAQLLPGLSSFFFFFFCERRPIWMFDLQGFAVGLITAVPYALLADIYGQKPFIVLNAFGLSIMSAAVRIICKSKIAMSTLVC